jgi:hypothetical protein
MQSRRGPCHQGTGTFDRKFPAGMPRPPDECCRDNPIACHGISLRQAVEAVVSRRKLGQNGYRFSEPLMQAIIEGDRDVYAAFAKCPDASSRIFTAWGPDSIHENRSHP